MPPTHTYIFEKDADKRLQFRGFKPRAYFVIPDKSRRPHIVDDPFCWCKPTVERRDGNLLYIHNSTAPCRWAVFTL